MLTSPFSRPWTPLLTDALQTDWEKVASVANVKTSKYARDQFAIIRTKLCGGKAKGDTASPTKTPTKPKAGKATQPRKRKKPEGECVHLRVISSNRTNSPPADDNDGVSQDSANEESTPKAKKTRKTRKVKVVETEAEAEGGEQPMTPTMQEEQAAVSGDHLEPEDEQEDSFFEAEMFHMN
jgi:hypothetical protein